MNLMGNRYFWLFGLVFLATVGLWFRVDLFGFDSYATVSAVRFGWFDNLAGQPLANVVWFWLPDSVLVFKALMFASIFVSVLALWKLVCFFYDERSAWLSIFLLLGLSPLFLFGFGEFENEVLAYPFIVWAVYWFLTSKSLKVTILSIVSLGVGTCFWFWPYYLNFFNFGFSRGAIEQNMFAGLVNLWFLLPFVFFIPLLGGKLKWFGLVGVGLWLWNAKLFIFLLPFVVLAIPKGLEIANSKRISLNWLYYLAFFGLFCWNIAFLMQSPTVNDWESVDKTIELSKDNNFPIFNDWSYGYWFWSKGIKVKSTPGKGVKINYQGVKGIYLTDQNLPCVLIYEKKEFARKKTKIWQCN